MNILFPQANALLPALVLALAAGPVLADAVYQEGSRMARTVPHVIQDGGGPAPGVENVAAGSFSGPPQAPRKWKYQHRKEDYALDYSAQHSQKTIRMSAEERRALRRQINEVGNDIYLSGH